MAYLPSTFWQGNDIYTLYSASGFVLYMFVPSNNVVTITSYIARIHRASCLTVLNHISPFNSKIMATRRMSTSWRFSTITSAATISLNV